MTDRLVKILEQDKHVMRGLMRRGKAAVLTIDDNETLDVTFDWSHWLGSDTIDSVTNEVSGGASIASAANTTTQASFNVSGNSTGWVQHRITTAAGLTKEQLLFVEINGNPVADDYGSAWRLS